METLEKRVSIAIKFIKRYKKNIKFINERINIQNKEGYDPYKRTMANGYVRNDFFAERQYTQFDLSEMQRKMKIVKLKLESL